MRGVPRLGRSSRVLVRIAHVRASFRRRGVVGGDGGDDGRGRFAPPDVHQHARVHRAVAKTLEVFDDARAGDVQIPRAAVFRQPTVLGVHADARIRDRVVQRAYRVRQSSDVAAPRRDLHPAGQLNDRVERGRRRRRRRRRRVRVGVVAVRVRRVRLFFGVEILGRGPFRDDGFVRGASERGAHGGVPRRVRRDDGSRGERGVSPREKRREFPRQRARGFFSNLRARQRVFPRALRGLLDRPRAFPRRPRLLPRRAFLFGVCFGEGFGFDDGRHLGGGVFELGDARLFLRFEFGGRLRRGRVGKRRRGNARRVDVRAYRRLRAFRQRLRVTGGERGVDGDEKRAEVVVPRVRLFAQSGQRFESRVDAVLGDFRRDERERILRLRRARGVGARRERLGFEPAPSGYRQEILFQIRAGRIRRAEWRVERVDA